MSFDELKQLLKETRGLNFLKEKTDRVSNKIYIFSQGNKQFVLKGLSPEDFEIKVFSEYLPKIKNTFKYLVIPELIDLYNTNGETYLLFTYYAGETFDFNTSDMNLASQLVNIVQDLSSIDVDLIVEGGNNFDYKNFERRFWEFFYRAVKMDLVKEELKNKCIPLLESGRVNQKMIISNGDFNPRNIIRLENAKLVLIDWNGVVFPLEHLLTYPWLLNWQNPSWQKEYANQFQRSLPVETSRIRTHLMNISLQRAVGEKNHNTEFADRMFKNHMKNFYASLEGFASLDDLCG